MTDVRGIAVTGAGALSAVGLTLIQTAASVRAGLNRFVDYGDFSPANPEFDFSEPAPLQGARVPGLGLDDVRIPALLTGVLRDLLRRAPLKRAQLGAVALHLGLPETGRRGSSFSGEMARELVAHATQNLLSRVVIHEAGRCAGLTALSAAAADLAERRAELCIAASVDSFHSLDALEWLDETGRLKSERNRNGFIPGEGAGALLLEPEALARRRNVPFLARLDGYASSRAPGGRSDGGTLAQAIGQALAGQPLSWVACDLNGESERAREWGLCQVRLAPRTRELRTVWHPADCWGEVGAATGTLLAGLVCRAFERGYAPAERCVVFAGSDDGTRAALALRRPD